MTIGLDIGGINIKGVLMSGNKVVARKKILTKSKTNKEILIGQIFECIEDLLRKGRNIKQIGIGVPGPVDFKNQKILNPPNVTSLKDTYLGKEIKNKFITTPKFGVVIDNDVHCLVLGEAVLGSAKNKKMVVGLGLGTGVGGGIVKDKKLLHKQIGEVGHTVIDMDGRQCTCGSKGCLETYISERGIQQTAQEIFNKKIDTITLFKMAKKGNKKAIKVWEITGKYLGIGLSNIVDALNPDIIVIGGGIAGAGEFLLKPAREQMKKNILSPLAKDTKVVRAKLGEYAGAIGAGLLHF